MNTTVAPQELIKDATDASFPKDVMEASLTRPVIVDFWAPWCGPCKQLGPTLEAAVQAAGGAVTMVKINIDENPAMAQQLQVQSIPAVFAFAGGQPVDGFMGAQPESQLKEFVAKIAAMGGGNEEAVDPVVAAMEQADTVFEEGDINAAADIYTQVLEHVAGHVGATTGLALCYLKMGSIEGAEGLLEGVPAEAASDPDVIEAKAALTQALAAAEAATKIEGLKAAVVAAPDDQQAKFDLAVGLFTMGDVEDGMEMLLAMFGDDREWNGNAARLELLKMFDSVGHADPVVMKIRRRLSTMMFS